MARKRLNPVIRRMIHSKTNGRCAYCGRELKYEAMQVDHLTPLYQNGEDILENMLPACRSCNHYKGGGSLESFRQRLEQQPAVLMRDNVTYQIAVRFGQVRPTPHKVVFYFERMMQNEQN